MAYDRKITRPGTLFGPTRSKIVEIRLLVPNRRIASMWARPHEGRAPCGDAFALALLDVA